jgi:hypothetical protein
MKYEQPYGVSDPNAAYINGNPSTGTMGSIPPAASIENPQREIVNLIADAGLTPTDADLHQLARSVQSSHLMYAVDSGTANALAFNVMPALLAYAAGQRWTVRVAATNTGPSVANISSLGARQIVYPLGGAMKGGELQAGGIVTLVDDGTNLQLTNVSAVTSTILTAPKTYYVNAATGSDSAYDGTTATVSGLHGPFATVQRALTAAYTWNQNGFNITIMLADGTYPPFVCSQAPNGAGGILIIGNLSAAENVIIYATAGEAIQVSASGYFFQGLSVASDGSGPAPHAAAGIRTIGATLLLKNINFGYCNFAHMFIDASSAIVFSGADGGNPGDYIHVRGTATYHMYCVQGSLIRLGAAALSIFGSFSLTWALCSMNAVIGGNYASITGVCGGPRFLCTLNGVINTGGGVNYFPGDTAGTVNTGGQVI